MLALNHLYYSNESDYSLFKLFSNALTSDPPLFVFNTAPLVLSMDAQRLNDTAVNFTVSLGYTGGGDITEFIISFQSAEIPEHVQLPAVMPLQLGMLGRVWNAVAVSDLFSERTELMFSVSITNSRQLRTQFTALEEIGMFC